MLIAAGTLVLVGLHVVPRSVGIVVVAAAIVFELAEKGFWYWVTRRIPQAVGAEAEVPSRDLVAVSLHRPAPDRTRPLDHRPQALEAVERLPC
jgi:hypothetical protein